MILDQTASSEHQILRSWSCLLLRYASLRVRSGDIAFETMTLAVQAVKAGLNSLAARSVFGSVEQNKAHAPCYCNNRVLTS
jgi:hypothetical protein